MSWTSTWPGTQLVGHRALVNLYRFSPAAVAVLSEADGLFDWCAPDGPEDLAFYVTPDGPWMGSIAHEGEAFVYADAIDVDALRRAVPGLQL